MDNSPAAKKRGRKPKYVQEKSYQEGAPRLATRVSPEVLEWIQRPGGQKRPEGTRPYIERIVLKDKAETLAQEPVVSTDPADVPGQLLMPIDGEEA